MNRPSLSPPSRPVALLATAALTAGLLVPGPAAAAAPGPGALPRVETAAAGDWPQWRNSPTHTGNNAAEHILSPANVAGLKTAWVAGAGWNSSPAVAGGAVYVSTSNLYAFPVNCAQNGGTCAPLWWGASGYADWSSPAVVDGVVYIGGARELYAFAAGCRSDGGQCAPLWTGTSGNQGYTSPTVAGGMVFVATLAGRLDAYNAAACAAAGGACSPRWTADIGGESHSSPAVAGGVVYVGSHDGFIRAFAVGCATGGGTCSPLWKGTISASTQSSPAVSGGVVYIGSDDGNLYAFSVGCGSGGATCTPIWKGVAGDGAGYTSPAVADGVVYIGAGPRLYAFAVGCGTGGATCTPIWKSVNTGEPGGLASSPAVANGVVYVGSQGPNQRAGRLYAFAVGCGTGGAECAPLWTSQDTGGMINASPAVSNGVVYIASNNGYLYAFDLGVDVNGPSVTAPLPSVRVPATLGSGSTNISWSGSDDITGIVKYQLQQKSGTGVFTNVPLPTPTSTSVSRALLIAQKTQFRVRATDAAGNVSPWATGPAFTPLLFENTNGHVVYKHGPWKVGRNPTSSGGSTSYATAADASAQLTFTGRTVAYVTPTGPSRGSARVFVDGVLLKTVNLHKSPAQPRQVLFTWTWPTIGTHTIRVVVAGTPGHPRVDLDAFLVLK